MNAVLTYFREAVEELHKVRWPTRQQAVRLSIVVLVFAAITSLAFGLVDAIFAEAMRLFLSSLI